VKNQNFVNRLGFAISGLKLAVRSEKSIRFQMLAAVAAFLLLLIFRPEPIWWAIIIVMVVMVLAAELFNTALEILCDFVQPDHHEAIKQIKDVAAGAVLVVSIGSVLVGLFFLGQLLF